MIHAYEYIFEPPVVYLPVGSQPISHYSEPIMPTYAGFGAQWWDISFAETR